VASSSSFRCLALALTLGLGASPATALVCGESIEGTISVPSEVDIYTFQAQAGDVMSVSVGGPYRFTSFGVAAELLSPTNKIVNFRRILDQTVNSPLCNAHLTGTAAPVCGAVRLGLPGRHRQLRRRSHGLRGRRRRLPER